MLLYGLKQAPRARHSKITQYLHRIGFRISKSDNSLYVRSDSESPIVIILYVDDLVIGGEHLGESNKVKSHISSKFEMTYMKELHYFLGIEVIRTRTEIMISQRHSEEADNILDIQFMSRGCYHVEFATEESVNKLLAIKEAGVEGAWVSFHKWFHNVKVDDILQDQEASMVFTAIFPGLRKEWRNVLPRIGALLGKVIATRDGQAHGSDRMGGVPAVRLIAPRSVRLPATISLPNLLLNKPPVVQKVYYQGLPDQCFVCRQFGHLGRDCQKRRTYNEAQTPNRPNVNYDGWSTISNKHVFKPSNTMVNPMLLLEANPYHALQEVEKDAGITAMEVGLAFPNLTKEDRVEQNAQDILLKVQTVESVSKVNNQWNNDKHMLLDKLKQDDRSLLVNKGGKMEVGKVDLPHVDMDCGNIIAFTTATTFSDRVSIVDKHVPVRAHKLSGKDIWSNRRQLRASEDGRKGRDVALTEKRAGGKNINDG